MNSTFKKGMPYFVAAVLFILLAVIYCSPVLEGKVVVAADSVQPRAAGQETNEYYKQTGNGSFWSNSMFGGMPNYQTAGSGGKTLSAKVAKPVLDFMRWGHRNQIFILIFYFFAFFVLMRSFGVDKWLSIVGAIAVAFSSYFFIIIAASHNGKTTSIIWMTVALVGMMLIFRKKYLLGVITVMMSVMAGVTVHPQMSYYIMMLAGLIFFAEIYIHIKEKRVKDLLIGTVIFAAAFVVGAGTQSAGIFANAEYTEQTMRGGHSEIVKETDSIVTNPKGLDIQYATQWSYGISESMTFLIPNFMGGSSHYTLGEDSHTYKTLISNNVPRNSARSFIKQVPTYWGTQPFTSGPVYMGAIVIFLFVLSLFIVKGPYKWALLAATIFSVLLSWGHNFMWFTQLFFNYFPMYNKFRAVSSILIVAEITIPLLGFLAIKAIMDKQIEKKKLIKNIQWSAGITGGICLIFALFGGMLDFSSPNDAQVFAQLPEWLGDAIIADRAAMLKGDALRSLIFIVLGMSLLWLFVKEKVKLNVFVMILGVLILADMWQVNKRFFNDDTFSPERNMKASFVMQPYEKMILDNDKDPNFRVFNLTSNPFSEARTSYYLKSIGGYSAAKLRRYQDLIDEHISKADINSKLNMISERSDVLDMLNTKYFIVKMRDGSIMPLPNPNAMGNAWFIDSVLVVDTPNEESDALNTINLRNTAVLDKKFAAFVENFVIGQDSIAEIHLTKYTPEYIEYESKSGRDGVAVFSEIYYPYGWKAYIDGKFVEHFRVNYMLRALNIPAGEHHIRFEFRPDSIKKGDRLALISLGILFLTVLSGIGYWIWKKRKKS